jgi:hypothetical protein
MSNSLGTASGQAVAQSPQPVQSSAFTKRGFLRMRTLKLPTKPLTSATSE